MRAWNRLAAAHDALWPQVRLSAGDLRNLTALPSNDIDADFRDDLENMLESFGSTLLKPPGFTKAYSTRTLE